MKALREPQAVRWVRRGGAYRLARASRYDNPSPLVASRPGVPRPACPLALILYATFAPFVFGILGWLAYLLR